MASRFSRTGGDCSGSTNGSIAPLYSAMRTSSTATPSLSSAPLKNVTVWAMPPRNSPPAGCNATRVQTDAR